MLGVIAGILSVSAGNFHCVNMCWKVLQSVIWRSFNELDQFVVAVLRGLVQ
jgi:hypothetical protein